MSDAKKVLWCGVVAAGIFFTYLILAAVMPAFTAIVAEADTALLASTSNISNYPGTREILTSSPWWVWFVPPVIAGVTVMLILRAPREE